MDIASVRDVSFPVALRGYDRDAVDAYVQDVNRIIAELLDQVSDETRGILERAHETSDEITARSRAQADDRLQWAEREAREAITAATERVHELEADAERVWQERQALVDDVSRIATELNAIVEDAGVRYPAEPELETTPLPELPPLPDTASKPSTGGPDDDTRPQPAAPSAPPAPDAPPPPAQDPPAPA